LIKSSNSEIPPEAIRGFLVTFEISISRSKLGPVNVPSFVTSVTTYLAALSSSNLLSVSKRSPPSFVHPLAASVLPRTSNPIAILSSCN
jgi:hypothetical protein